MSVAVLNYEAPYILAEHHATNSNSFRPSSHSQFYPTRAPFANGTRRVARIHTASTASGSSGTLRPHQEVFSVDANGSRRVGAAVWMLEWTRPVRVFIDRLRKTFAGTKSALAIG